MSAASAALRNKRHRSKDLIFLAAAADGREFGHLMLVGRAVGRVGDRDDRRIAERPVHIRPGVLQSPHDVARTRVGGRPMDMRNKIRSLDVSMGELHAEVDFFLGSRVEVVGEDALRAAAVILEFREPRVLASAQLGGRGRDCAGRRTPGWPA